MWHLALLAVILLPVRALAYEVETDRSGAPVRWPEGGVTIDLHPPPPELDPERLHEAVGRALAAWNHAAEGAVRLTFRAAEGPGEAGYHPSGPNENAIAFAVDDWLFDEDALAVTLLSIDVERHAIVDADIVFNTAHKTFAFFGEGDDPPASARAHDVQNTLTHELGHVMGLAHEPEEPLAVMFPTAPPGETRKRNLHPDDVEGVRYLYLGDIQIEDPLTDGTGCSTAGALSLLALTSAVALLSRRARLGLAAAALLAPGLAGASEIDPAPERFAALAKKAAAAVRGTVVSTRVIPGKVLYTEVTLRSRDGEVKLIQPGGRLGNLEQKVAGSTPLTAGEEVIVLLRALRGGGFGVRGRDEGVLRLEGENARGADGRLRPLSLYAPALPETLTR